MTTNHPTARQIRDSVASWPAAAPEAVEAALDRTAERDPSLHAFTQVFGDEARRDARSLHATLTACAHAPPLAGVPIAVKDNICTTRGRTTCASRFLEDYRSPFDATAIRKLQDAGAIILAKTNLDEFAMGSSCEHSAFGPTRNPWDESRTPGGSSGGSAAAVAAGIVPIALGSDTGGSVRQPAAMCGVVGLKPTYGRVSRYGLVAFASSLDQIGILSRTVADAAIAMQVIAGRDPHDATSADRPPPDTLSLLDTPVDALRIGVPRQVHSEANHPAVTQALAEAARTFTDLGAAIVEVDLPHADHGIAAYYLIACAEASSNLARFDGIRYGRRAALAKDATLEDLYVRSRTEGFGAEVRRRIMLGTFVLSAGYYDQFYQRAMRARRLIHDDFARAFAAPGPACNAILMPTTPTPAFKLGEKIDDPLALYLQDLYTVGVNLAGLPAISLPAGFAEVDGVKLPTAIQLIAPPFQESVLLRIARMFERAGENRCAG